MHNRDIKWIVKSIETIMFKNGFSSIVINKTLKGADLDKREENMHRQVVYGTIEHWLYLEYLLNIFVKKRIKKDLKCFLMAGLYELFFLSGRESHAVVNRYVDTAKVEYPHAAKFVNAIMRNALRQKPSLEGLSQIETISLTYSYPQWLVERWFSQFGEEITKEMLYQSSENRRLYLRVNLNCATVEQVLEHLAKHGVEAHKSEHLDIAIEVVAFNEASLTQLEGYKEGWFTVQDLSSMLVGAISGVKVGDRVLDLCSAPGGKATDFAQRVGKHGHVIACDIHEHKLNLVTLLAERLHLENIEVQNSDARKHRQAFVEKFDTVLLDAPCSGLGIISKKPEIKYRKSMQDINNLVSIQKNMLDIACDYVKIGGNLIYSTCTIEPLENEVQIEQFLKRHINFELLNLGEHLKTKVPVNKGMISIKPNRDWGDGFFIAMFKRRF